MNRQEYLWLGPTLIAAFFSVVTYIHGDARSMLILWGAIPLCAVSYLVFRALRTPFYLQFLVAVFYLFSWILGDVFHFYSTYWWWDLFLHGFSPFIAVLIFREYLQRKKLPFTLIMVLSVLAVVGLGAFWEIYEFLVGVTLPTAKIIDTITDMIANSIGALVALVVAYVLDRPRDQDSVPPKRH